MTANRPPYPFEGPGIEWEAVEEGTEWSAAYPVLGWKCRRRGCPNEPIAMLFRRFGSRGRRPWRYCADHMYGRWVEDGRVMSWRVVR